MHYLILMTIIFSPFSLGGIYSCLDKNGNKVFTDNKATCSSKKNYKAESYNKNLQAIDGFYNEIPDLLQTLGSANFPGDGAQFCGPVAVSNSLVWLEGKRDERYQINLVKTLSSSEYMNTNTKNGTGTTGLLKGIDRYVTEVFGGHKRLKYSGWRKAPNKYRSLNEKPTVVFMQSGLNKKGAVWLNIGWYKVNLKTNDYRRVGGHWVTLVGYEKDQLIIHDPAPRAGRVFSNEFVTYSALKNGRLTGKKQGMPLAAKGFYKLGSGMHSPKKADVAIIDGAVVLQI